jgi:Fuc2NAc and GlcNAc transferase
MSVIVAVCLATAVLTALLTGVLRALAVRGGVLDVPNARSSHSSPTPRGGGGAIVLVMSAALLALFGAGLIERPLLAALGVGGLVIAAVGFRDDRRALAAGVRLAVHTAAAVWALWCLGGLPPLRCGAALVDLGWGGQLLGLLGIIWVLNLFNFMDGIDGIAASEAVFIALAGGALAAIAPAAPAVAVTALVFAAACLGFLWWNWPPARIFLGDIGSGYLGYVIAVLALAATRANPAAVWVWLILGGVFFVDATVTLTRRAARGERVHQAHRSHAYQRLTRRWGGHRAVTLTVWAVNLLWLLPCAVLAALRPSWASWLVLAALAPLVLLTVVNGAGRSEPPAPPADG